MLINGGGYNLWPEVLKDLYKQGLRSKIYPYSTGLIRGGYDLDKHRLSSRQIQAESSFYLLLLWLKFLQ